jgi:DNA-binding transcriptional regulator YiaG
MRENQGADRHAVSAISVKTSGASDTKGLATQAIDTGAAAQHNVAMIKLPTMTPERLRAARLELGLTQEQAAEKYGVSLSGYKKWELGLAATPGTAAILTKYLLSEFRNTNKI